jgi:hypothetical protein
MALPSSMLDLQVRANDQPRHWPSQVKTWFRRSI